MSSHPPLSESRPGTKRTFLQKWFSWLTIIALCSTLLPANSVVAPVATAQPVQAIEADVPTEPIVQHLRFAETSTILPCGPVAANRILHLPLIVAPATQATTALNVASAPMRFAPNPVTVAPPIDPSVPTEFSAAVRFLYTGANPIQTGVAENTINPLTVAVIRGCVRDAKNEALPGVQVSIHHRPEFGSTLTGLDGQFNLAVNGGGTLVLNYEKQGTLAAQRTLAVPVRDYIWAEPVALLDLDPMATTLDLSASGMQVAQGSVISDTDGIRQARILIPQGTQAEMVKSDGSTQALPTVTIRATEYTVGENGPESMPGTLPPQSGYTYAVEYSVDQAMSAGASDVRFNQPIYNYVENFLNFPVGTPVPAGFYDRTQAKWVPAPSGIVIKILAIANGLAEIDTDGDTIADNSAALGITVAERQRLATLYQAGQSLWRVPVTHFSSWDYNWPFGPPVDAEAPPNTSEATPVASGKPAPNPNCKPGSIIECENQSLRERIDIVGTPFSLNYRNEYTPGRTANNTIRIPLSTATIPASLKRIDLEVTAGGRLFTQSFAAVPNQAALFTWDGNDAYERRVLGKQLIRVRLGYTYAGSYQRTDRFGYNGNGTPISGDLTRQEVTLWRDWYVPAGTWDARGLGLGGWMLSDQHVLDPVGNTIYFGHGAVRSVNPTVSTVIDRFAGLNGASDTGDGGPAIDADLRSPDALAVAADGSVYVGTLHRIRKIDSNGIITTVVGTGNFGFNGDGGPATQARVNNVGAIALAPDGSLYFTDKSNNRIRRVDPNGIITTIAGTGVRANSGDGGSALQAALYDPIGMALAPDGTIYVGVANGKIRKIDAEGIINTIFDGSSGTIPGITQSFSGVSNDLKLDDNGNLYFQNSFGAQVLSLGTNGVVRAVSEAGGLYRQSGRFTIDPDGQVYVSFRFGTGGRIYRVNDDTTLTPIAGRGSRTAAPLGDGGPPLSAEFDALGGGMEFAPDRTLYVTEYFSGRVRNIRPPIPRYSATTSFIPAEDGSEIYVFGESGRHERTIYPLTGAVLLQFGYNTVGLLSIVTDGDGDVTRIERDANGTPTAIVAQDGQRTTLGLDTNGYLNRLTNPAGEATQFGYSSGGLLTSMIDARGATATYSYDPDGRLIGATDRADATKTLARTGSSVDSTISYADQLGRTTTYAIDKTTDQEQRVSTLPDGTQIQTTYLPDGTQQLLLPNGMRQSQRETGDPRFGMLAPIIASETITTPAGLRYQSFFTRTTTLAAPTRVLSLTTEVDQTNINGRIFTSSYNAANRTFSLASPLGRTSQIIIDTQGRLTQSAAPGIDTVAYGYDGRGRLVTISQGAGGNTRSVTISYNVAGYVGSITDPLGQATTFVYDATGRVTQQIEPGNRSTSFAYDANGNLVGLTPPGRSQHSFSYTATDLTATYTPPDLGAGSTQTSYSYNAAQQLTQVTQPGGRTIALGYDSAGRTNTLTTARGTTSYSYSPTSGQLVGITSPGALGLSYTYDGGLLTNVTTTGTIAGQIGYSYDNDFRITATTVNGGNSISFGYDNDGFLTSAGILTLSYNTQNGLLTGTTVGNTSESWGYSSFAEPSTYQVTNGGNTLYNVAYTRDKLSRITQKVETIGGIATSYTYTYDAAGRLTEVRRAGALVEQYSYDDNGNRTSVTVAGVAATGSYDAQDRLLSYGGRTYTYLANGELRTRVQAGQTTTYDYDALGNLVSVALPSGTQIGYLIDGQNRRIGKQVNGTLVQGFLYESQLRPVAELNGSGQIVSRFVYATGINVPDYMIRGGVTYRLIRDQVGGVRLVVNAATGAIAQRIDYDSFGNVSQDTNPGFQPFGFAGGLYDRDTGLVRFGARDYDSVVGRWTAKDPIGFAGGDTNLYAYVGNNPLFGSDPEGTRIPFSLIVYFILRLIDFSNDGAISGRRPDNRPSPSDNRPSIHQRQQNESQTPKPNTPEPKQPPPNNPPGKQPPSNSQPNRRTPRGKGLLGLTPGLIPFLPTPNPPASPDNNCPSPDEGEPLDPYQFPFVA